VSYQIATGPGQATNERLRRPGHVGGDCRQPNVGHDHDRARADGLVEGDENRHSAATAQCRLYRGFARHGHVVIKDLSTGIIVSTLVDENDRDYSDGDLSLRESLLLASQRTGDDVIEFQGHTSRHINLQAALGQLIIDSNVEIQGLGADQLTVSGGNQSRVFLVQGGVTAEDQRPDDQRWR